ncbi:zinc-binding dehydrogenase [Spirosoma rhododendri]|uniref:zinc-binding dehydrogenase n=1 Tax=Spirosoma rhododendri TaxID=2728024 RepID=UPI001C2CBDCA|nr:zinc-binding dehydrogenase [Spirosoma rhododendri]
MNTKTEDGYAKVMEFTGGRGVDIAFECAGGPSMPVTLPQATSFARIGGKVVIVGGFETDQKGIELDWAKIQLGEIQLIPSASYSFWGINSEMQMCLDLLANGKLNAQKLITHRFPLDEINKAFETAQDKEHTRAVFVALLV